MQAMEPAGRTPGDVEETPGIEPQCFEQAINAADSELGEIGQIRAQVRRADGGQAEHPFSPGRLGEQSPGVQTSHAVTDDMNRFLGEGAKDPIAQPPGAELHAGDRMDPRHQHPVSRRSKIIRNSPEIGRQRERPQPDPGESEQARGPVQSAPVVVQPWEEAIRGDHAVPRETGRRVRCLSIRKCRI